MDNRPIVSHKILSTIILLIGLRLIKGQCLHLSNFSSLEVEDIHCVHFNVIDVDFGIRAIVNLGKKRRNTQGLVSVLGPVPMGLTQLVLEENAPQEPPVSVASSQWHATRIIIQFFIKPTEIVL